MIHNMPNVTWRLFTCVWAHVSIGDYVSRLRAQPELESAGLHDKTRPVRAKGRVFRSRERKAPVVLSYEPSVTQAAWNSVEELEIIHRCHQANWRSPDRHRRDNRVASRSASTWIRADAKSIARCRFRARRWSGVQRRVTTVVFHVGATLVSSMPDVNA